MINAANRLNEADSPNAQYLQALTDTLNLLPANVPRPRSTGLLPKLEAQDLAPRAIAVSDRVPSSSGLRTKAPEWWRMPADTSIAADAFDTRHRKRLSRASKVIDRQKSRPLLDDLSFWRATFEVTSNRFVLAERLVGTTAIQAQPRRAPKKRFSLYDSVWANRRKSSDAKDFYDTLAVKQAAFDHDWAIAIDRMKLEKKCQRATKGLGADVQSGALSALCEGLLEYKDPIYELFTFYSQLGNDMFSVSANSFLQFVRDCELARNDIEGQRDQDLQLIFDSANAAAAKEDLYNHKRNLNRYEWIGVLAQVQHLECASFGPPLHPLWRLAARPLPCSCRACTQTCPAYRVSLAQTFRANWCRRQPAPPLISSLSSRSSAMSRLLVCARLRR